MASNNNTVSKIYDLAKPLCDELGLMLWDVRYEKEGITWYLRVLIDKDGGVDINDCENFSRPFNKTLDELDPIKEAYVFEVSGAGLGRELKRPEHFTWLIGNEVRVRLIRANDDGREFVGTLKSFEKPNFVIETDGSELELSTKDCAFVKLTDDENLF